MTAEVCARFDTAEKLRDENRATITPDSPQCARTLLTKAGTQGEITMNDPAASLRRKITSAGELESVVRTMKAMSASSIGQYESAALSDGATGLGRVFPAGANRTVSLDCESRKPSLPQRNANHQVFLDLSKEEQRKRFLERNR
jgi:hypothetical protein